MAEIEKIKITLDSQHEGIKVSHNVYQIFSIIKWLVHLSTGIYISNMLYKEVLFTEKSNPIVTTYFCLIALGCFLNVGLPIEKLANISLAGK